MTIHEIEDLLEDTRKLPRAAEKVALSIAIGTEIARQLAILNDRLASESKAQAVNGKQKKNKSPWQTYLIFGAAYEA